MAATEEAPASLVLNYGTPADAQAGAESGFAPPKVTGDYKLKITKVSTFEYKEDKAVARIVIAMSAVEDAKGEKVRGYCEYMFFNIPQNLEQTYDAKLGTNRQKYKIRQLLECIGVNMAKRDAAGKTSTDVNMSSWVGKEVFGHVKVGLNKYTDKNGNQKENMKGEVVELFSATRFAERSNASLTDTNPLAGGGGDGDDLT